ncbi:MAG: EamA family transporter [Candidatus Berkelbacteria bacterium]
MLSALLASISYAGTVIIDKLSLSARKVPVKIFVPLVFIFLAGLTALLLPKFGALNLDKINLYYIFIFLAMIVTAVIWNAYYYRSLEAESLHEFELIMLLSPLVTVIFAAIFLPSERDWIKILIGVIASAAFVFTKIKKDHIVISKTTKTTLLAMLLMSLEAIFIKISLDIMSPVTLYFIRTFIVAIVFLVMYRPNFTKIVPATTLLVLFTSALAVVSMVLKFYGFKELGIVETTIILLLGPLLVQLYSFFLTKEKSLSKRENLCLAVVIGCILFSLLR